jgi:tetratricopeptide (TPR) repeat protein
VSRQDEKQRLRRRLQDLAISLANKNEWSEAVDINRQILELEEDPTTHNRLGKAFLEMGLYQEALESYQQTLQMSPTNTIARRNMARLETLLSRGNETLSARSQSHQRVDPRIFITEAGKTMVTSLLDVPRGPMLEALASGEKVELSVEGNHVLVTHPDGNIIGRIEPKIGQRLSQLILGGNRYIAAVVQADSRQVRILIREIFQDPSQRSRTSFPGRLVEHEMYDYLATRYEYETDDLLEDEDSRGEPDILPEELSGNDDTEEIGLEDIEKNINEDDDSEEE